MSTSMRVHEILFVGEVHASEVDGDDSAVELVRRDVGPQTRCSGVRASATRRHAREGHLCTVNLLLDNRPAYTLQDTEADPIDPKGASARVAAVNRAALVGAFGRTLRQLECWMRQRQWEGVAGGELTELAECAAGRRPEARQSCPARWRHRGGCKRDKERRGGCARNHFLQKMDRDAMCFLFYGIWSSG
ncbi:hypothetical protein BRADI_4g29284v3 [Brachypodium distachyon]|uniref:Uncharacterized protein n=1 Tax=Brachypodium distachyon TaxID=15368 RepID=A0A2K2CR48_BRADI|nr:hypothetical protein BRADI_4g29284v3 [Brachypodium distachyon]